MTDKLDGRYILGLDIGTASLGWAAVRVDDDGKPCKITDAGVRIFGDGRDSVSKQSKAAERTAARQTRRQRRRKNRRKAKAADQLRAARLLPPSDSPADAALFALDPYALRAQLVDTDPDALLTDELRSLGVMPLHLFGRAMFSIARRRGFKSNRHTPAEASGKIAAAGKAATAAMAATGSETYGQYLYRRQQQGETVLARPEMVGGKVKGYPVYPQRDLTEAEFDALWRRAAKLSNRLNDRRRRLVRGAIFDQRPLKAQRREVCQYMTGEIRCYRAEPEFQRYRILQDLGNLKFDCGGGETWLREHPDLLAKFAGRLMRGETIRLTELAADIADDLDLAHTPKLNFENGGRRRQFGGDGAAAAIAPVIGGYHDWPLARRGGLVRLLIDKSLDDAEIADRLADEFDQPAEKVAKLLAVVAGLDDTTASISAAAAQLVGDRMADGLDHTSAVRAVAADRDDFDDPLHHDTPPIRRRLPHYSEILGEWISNPTVKIALVQMQAVVNEIISRHGTPVKVHIETARDLQKSAKELKELKAYQDRRETENKKLNAELRSWPDGAIDETAGNRKRLRMWRSQHQYCTYSGRRIQAAQLFTDEVEVEHIVPISRGGADSDANKVLAFRDWNRAKGRNAPAEVWSGDELAQMRARAEAIRFEKERWGRREKKWLRGKDAIVNKAWAFADDPFVDDGFDDWTDRHINDTRYISRLALRYLESVVGGGNVVATTGSLTAMVRRRLGLLGIVGGEQTKTRDDHRHHAIDAIAVAMTRRSVLQGVTEAVPRGDDEAWDALRRRMGVWPSFRAEAKAVIGRINVSHKQPRSDDIYGQLHDDTVYNFDRSGRPIRRVAPDTLKADEIGKFVVDPKLRADLRRAFDAGGKNALADFTAADGRRVRRVRVTKSRGTPQRIGKTPKTAKHPNAYVTYNNWGMEVYESPVRDKKTGKIKRWDWQGVLVTMLDAAAGGGVKAGRSARRERAIAAGELHCEARLVMVVQTGNILEMDDDDGGRRLVRVRGADGALRLKISGAESASKEAEGKRAMSYFKKRGARLAEITPAGAVTTQEIPTNSR